MHSAYRHIPWNLKTGSLEDVCMFIFFITLCIIINLRMLILLWRNHVYKNDIYNRNFVWYIQFRHTLLVKDKTITETALLLTVTISKLESDGFHSSNLAIALLIGICMYIFSLLHLMMTVLDALPSLHDISILHNNRLNDYELTGPFEIRQKPWNFDQSLTVIIYTHQSRGAPCGSPRTMIP